MHLLIFNKKLSIIVGILICYFSATLFDGYSQQNAKKDMVARTKETKEWTDTVIGQWYIRIHAPEPGENPGIWEGPIEIGIKPGNYLCTVDISLIKGVRQGPGGKTLIIEGFSGSKSFEVEINVDSCLKKADCKGDPTGIIPDTVNVLYSEQIKKYTDIEE